MTHHQDQIRRILEDIAAGRALSQRTLAQRLGIALGLTNRLLRHLSRQGLITTVRDRGTRLTYALTPAGRDEHARMSREHLTRALESYSAARARIRRCLTDIAGLAGTSMPRVVFYGLGEAAEIGLESAAEAGVQLVGVVDDAPDREGTLRGVRVWPSRHLTPLGLAGEQFDWVLVTALSRTEDILRQLDDIGLPRERVSWF